MSVVGFGFSFGLVILENPEINPKLRGQPESTLGIEIISRIILYMNESSLLVKIAYIPIRTSHASIDHLNIDGPPFTVKCVRKFGSALGREITFRYVCVSMSYKMNQSVFG